MRWGRELQCCADLHLHTVASGHAFGTVSEMCAGAAARGCTVVGIADHGPAMIGAPSEGYFTMAADIAQWTGPAKVLFGCEANIVGVAGEVDLDELILRRLDFTMAGLHARTPYEQVVGGATVNTRAIIAAMEKRVVDVVAHPVSHRFPVRVEPIVEAAAEYDVVLEINARVLRNASSDVLERHRKLLAAVKEIGGQLIIGSDAHIPGQAAEWSAVAVLWNELREMQEQVINIDVARFEMWLERMRQKRCSDTR